MPSLGGFNFITLKGHHAPPAVAVEDISRPGVDGAAFRQLHIRADPFEVLGIVDCLDLNDARALFSDLRELRGSLVSFTDDSGDALTKVMVIDVRREDIRSIVAAAGGTLNGAARALLTVRFVLQETSALLS